MGGVNPALSKETAAEGKICSPLFSNTNFGLNYGNFISYYNIAFGERNNHQDKK